MTKSIKFGALLLVILATQGCGSSSSGEAPTELTTLFKDLADQVILPNYRDSQSAVAELAGDSGAIQQYCDAIGSANESAQLLGAQNAWKSAMGVWQRAEMHKLGPVIANNETLQNRILSYKQGNINTCALDQAVVLSQPGGFDISQKAPNQKGLGSVGYLLFNADLTHTCPGTIAETVDWDARTEQQRKEWRCDHARIVVTDIESAVNDVVSEWEIDGGNYRGVFINNLNNQASFKGVSDGLFYMDVSTKDQKLGLSLGISGNCSQPSCPTAIESRFSETSLANIKANIESFKLILTGNGGLGLDSLISDAQVPEVTERLLQYSNDALAEIDGMSVSLYDQAVEIDTDNEATECTNAYNSPDTASNFPACNLYGHIKRISDELKTGFVTATNSSIPESSQSDND